MDRRERRQVTVYPVFRFGRGQSVLNKRTGRVEMIATPGRFASGRGKAYTTLQSGGEAIPEENLIPLANASGAFLRNIFPYAFSRARRP